MKILERTEFGNPILRQPAKQLKPDEIRSVKIQELIANMRYTLRHKKYGVGLAATQVGEGIALSVIGVKPTPSRPHNPKVDMVIINPEIIAASDTKDPLWEGCVSFGDSNFPYALVPRHASVKVRWFDENAEAHEKTFDGIVAHVLQHEIDHLRGVLFVDRVEDTTSYMTINEYKKRYLLH